MSSTGSPAASAIRTGSAVLDRFAAGFTKFHDRNYRCECCHRDIGMCYQKAVDHGQHPRALVLYCSDSRSNSTDLFATEAGEIFSNSTVATLVPPRGHAEGSATWAAIEYAVEHLLSQHEPPFDDERGPPKLLVVGHYACGFGKAAIGHFRDIEESHGAGVGGSLGSCIDDFSDTYKTVRARFNPLAGCRDCTELHRHMVDQMVRDSVRNLEQNSYVSVAIAKERLDVRGLIDDIETGELLVLNRETGKFERLVASTRQAAVSLVAPHCAGNGAANREHQRIAAFHDDVRCAPKSSGPQ